MKTVFSRAIPVLVVLPVLFLNGGCATTDGGSGGWVVVGSPSETSTAQERTPPGKAKGLEVAARNHLRSAYRFLRKDKPDHALKELEKARAGLSRDYWFHYYMGGSFYLKAMYAEAAEIWRRAYRSTGDPHLRSRTMTCLSFAEYRTSGIDRSVESLGRAVDLDSGNIRARTFLEELKSAPAGDQDLKPGSRVEKDKPARDKAGKGTGKATKQGKKIEDRNQFMAYFLVEMTDE